MLQSLSIRDVVLIDRLDLSFKERLSVLTGETGAGKSILLDSLSLALGARADAGLVRTGATQLSVTAAFDPPAAHPARALVAEQGLEVGDEPLLLRRMVAADGRSRAYLNDQAVSVGLLRQIGDALVEIHGQFDTHGLMDPSTHRSVLDAFAEVGEAALSVREGWRVWHTKAESRAKAEAALLQARAEEDLLRHNLAELEALAPVPGEEKELAEKRSRLMHAQKLTEGVNAAFGALTGGADVEGALRKASQHLSRIADLAGSALTPITEALDRAAIELSEAVSQLERLSAEIDLDPSHLETAETRLFALRGAARKHGVEVDRLSELRTEIIARLSSLDDGGSVLVRLAKEEQAARAAYLEAARALSRARHAAAQRLDAAVNAELPPLKLDKATFRTAVNDLPESAWGESGLDHVAFEVATNPGTPPGAIGKIASGGELARFMLALKVVLAGASPIPTLVFDEVDTGIGGATADAVGERLSRLAQGVQVLVVTHSPQVAARGDHHWRVDKKEVEPGRIATSVAPLDGPARREEIARMLSGAHITDEARAAADRLLGA